MIKKISIITILTISLVFASFMIQKRRAEAVVPLAVYVAVTALIHFAVGAYIYLNSQSGINTETHKITNINPTTGKIDIEYLEDTKVGSTDQTPAHRVDEIGANEILNVYPEYASKGLSTGQGCNANFLWDQWSTQVVNSVDSLYDGDHIEYFQVNYGYWPAGNCTLMGAGAVMLDSSSNHVESSYDANGGVLGGSYTGTFGSEEVQMYEFIDDVPLLPDCFDGIQNQDETGIDCGGVCEMNFGFVCPPVETCADDIMNQDETGIDYGGVCGTDDPVAAPAENFTDTNQDGVDDLSGLDATGSITVASPGTADYSTYDTSLPGDISEVGETDWTGLITGYLATNPLVLLATGSSISLSGENCTLTANVFGSDIVLDFCSVEGMVDLIGTFVLGLMAIRSVFIAMGI